MGRDLFLRADSVGGSALKDRLSEHCVREGIPSMRGAISAPLVFQPRRFTRHALTFCGMCEQRSVDRLLPGAYMDRIEVHGVIRSGFSRQRECVVGLVALVYASLVVLAAACAFGHVESPGGHAHHGSAEAPPHSALCAWTCQAASDAVAAVGEPMAPGGPLVPLVAWSPDLPAASSPASPLHSRAPPSSPFLRIG